MANSKVVLSNGTVLIDLTSDTITAASLLEGVTAHGKDGEAITGACTYDSDTSDDTVSASEILINKTAHARGSLITGTMADNGGVTGEISTRDGEYVVPQGFHDGSGKVGIASAERAKIIPGNIKTGVEILGQTGTYSGEAITSQSKPATPTWSAQTIQPDDGYDYLSAVNVAAIPITYTDNSAGGQTVTIG